MAHHAAEHGLALAKRLGAKIIVTVTLPWDSYFSRELAVLVPDVVNRLRPSHHAALRPA